VYKSASKFISHAKEMGPRKEDKKEKANSLLIRCNFCNVHVRPNHMKKHIKRVHHVHLNADMEPAFVPSSSTVPSQNILEPKNKQVICPVCGLSVVRDFLLLHQTTPYCMRWLDEQHASVQRHLAKEIRTAVHEP
jgi:hypothetical protein